MFKNRVLRVLTAIPVTLWAFYSWKLTSVSTSSGIERVIEAVIVFIVTPIGAGFALATIIMIVLFFWKYLKWLWTGEWDDTIF